MKLFIASDHAGLDLKKSIFESLKSTQDIMDLGPFNSDSVDYPDYANLVCQKIKENPGSLGLLICGSGQGMNIRANKFSFIRAALVYNDEIAKLAREHNDCNVICIGSRFSTDENAKKWINIFINTAFSEGRHRQRVEKISQPT